MTQTDELKSIRKDILTAAKNTNKVGAHIAPSLSLVEIVYAVFKCYNKKQDEFILSKGHGALGYYAVMHRLGFITDEQFATFEQDGGDFPGQPSRNLLNNIRFSSGSLGMGLSYGVGAAYAKRNIGKVFAVLGDGELNEGSVWEAAALASHLKLNNLIAIIDHNEMQSDGRCKDIVTMNLMPIWKSFGWHILECNGHDVDEIVAAIKSKTDEPIAIIAHTIKGKGVTFMENNNEWHHNTLSREDYERAMMEI